jgi:phage terminase large subunit
LINAARLLFHVCVFDEQGCDVDLRRLGAYKEYFIDGNDEFSKKPKHDMASHCADAFRYVMYNFYFEPKERLTWQKDLMLYMVVI